MFISCKVPGGGSAVASLNLYESLELMTKGCHLRGARDASLLSSHQLTSFEKQ
jgi:hypothetical protein